MMKKRGTNIKVPGYNPDKVKLTKEEQAFEDRMDPSDYVERSQKSERTNIRIPHEDLALIRQTAARMGMPYQTLIGSVLHRFVTNQLVDVEEAMKIIEVERKRA